MELVCIDKQTFEELRVRFCEFEDRVTRLCRPVEDLGLKNWLDNQEVCDILRINKKTLTGVSCQRSPSFQSHQKQDFSTNRKIYGDYWN